MNKLVSIAFLVGGIVFIIYGLNAADSFGSDVSRAFTGNPTDRSIWFLVGGLVAAILGVSGLLRGSKIN